MFRVGSGHDTHRLADGRPLVLGGVRIDHPRGLVGHSDADAVLHAVTDALLGAAGLGDIGDAYPDTDPRWRGADSRLFLAETLAKLNQLSLLILSKNKIADLAPLVEACKADAAGPRRFAPYLRLYLAGNPLSDTAKGEQLGGIKAAGVRVEN